MAIKDLSETPGYTPNPVAELEQSPSSVPQEVPGQSSVSFPPASGGFAVPVSDNAGEGIGEVSDQTDVDAVQIDSEGIAAAVSGLFPEQEEPDQEPLETEEEVLADIAILEDAIANETSEAPVIYDASSGEGVTVAPEVYEPIDLGGSSVLETLAPEAYPKPVERRPPRDEQEVPERKPTFIEGLLGLRSTVDAVHDALPKSSPAPDSSLPLPEPLELPALTPNAASSESGEETAPQEASLITGLVSRGLPQHVAEGFVMNFRDESGLDPSVNEKAPLVEGSRGGYGLYQLTGPRRKAYEKYAKGRGVPVSSVDAQLDFLVHELKTTEKGAAARILNTSSKGQAAAEIVTRFLRPAREHRIARRARYLAASG